MERMWNIGKKDGVAFISFIATLSLKLKLNQVGIKSDWNWFEQIVFYHNDFGWIYDYVSLDWPAYSGAKCTSNKVIIIWVTEAITLEIESIGLSYLEVLYLHQKHLFGGTVPPPKKLFGGTIPPNNFFGGGTLMEISFW